MHFTMKKIFLILIMIFFIFLGTGCEQIDSLPRAEQGILDLRNWNLAESNMTSLDGKWDFYWNELLSYDELQKKDAGLKVSVPKTWDNYEIGHKPLPGEGIGTYRLRVKTNLPEGTLLAVRLRTVSSAYRLFINDKEVVHAGTVGTSAEEEKGEYHPKTAVFSIPSKQFDIIIQASNYHYARGGLWESIYLGDVNQIDRYDNMLTGREMVLLGALLIISFFYLAVFFLLKELRYTLYFSLFTLSAAVSVDTVGQFLLVNSVLPFKVVICIWYSATAWMTFFLVMFMHELFPTGFSKTVTQIYTWFMLISQLIYIFVDPSYYSKYAAVSNFSEVSALFVSLIIVLIGARKGHKNWFLNVISIIVLLIGYIHDILYLTNYFHGQIQEIFYFSALIALVLQMITQAQRIKSYFSYKVSAELMLLQAQIKPHFLYNTINTIISISRFDGERARNLLIDFSQYLRKSFDFKGSSQLVFLSDEIELAMTYITIEKTRFGNRLEVDFRLEDHMGDIKVPILILQPIIENAIIHGVLPKAEGGKVHVNIHREGALLCFTVKDDGVGMNKTQIDTILEKNGTHIGLPNINSRLLRLYKRGLEIKSVVNEGTEINWNIKIQ